MKISTSRRDFLTKSTMAATGVALMSSGIATAFESKNPYNGYNPYAEEKTDLRTSIFGNHIKVTGSIYNKAATKTISDATIEVWHLSPNSTKYRHRAKLKTNSDGSYTFLTDFPNREGFKIPRIFFKVNHNNKTVFTEVLINDLGAHITDKHWQEHTELGSKLLPVVKKATGFSTINFNISI